MTKPKICWYTNHLTMPDRKLEVLSQEFGVSQTTNPWRMPKCDLVICQSAKHAAAVNVAKLNLPYVVENHGDLFAFSEWVIRWSLKGASALRAVSAHSARQFDRFFKPEGGWKYLRIIPPWINVNVFRDAEPFDTKFGLPLIVYAGGESTNKGIEVFRYLLDHLRDEAVLVSITDTQQNLARWIKSATCVIVPSKEESFGRIIIESMIAGTPVIASRIPAFEELIIDHETGWLIKPDNLGGWKKRVRATIATPTWRKQISKAATEFVGKFWTEEKFVKGHVKLVEGALNEQI